jgi:hypothetical protein
MRVRARWITRPLRDRRARPAGPEGLGRGGRCRPLALAGLGDADIFRGDPRAGHPGAPPLRVVQATRWSGSSRRRRATRMCWRSSRRCTARARTRRSSSPDPRGGGGQAGGVPGRAAGAIRRGEERAIRAPAREGGRARGVRRGGAQDALQVLAGGAREERQGLRCYAHIGTGNYHPKTAQLYTDLGLLTCDPVDHEDVVNLFNCLTGCPRRRTRLRALLVAPFTCVSGSRS